MGWGAPNKKGNKMILDKLLKVSSAQALTATAYSTDTIDDANNSDISVGEPLVAVFQVNVAADFTTTDETYEFQVVDSANANLSAHNVLVSKVIPAAQLTANSIHYLPIPPLSKSARYLGTRYVLGGTTPSVTVTAYIQPQNMIQANKVYADNITIS